MRQQYQTHKYTSIKISLDGQIEYKIPNKNIHHKVKEMPKPVSHEEMIQVLDEHVIMWNIPEDIINSADDSDTEIELPCDVAERYVREQEVKTSRLEAEVEKLRKWKNDAIEPIRHLRNILNAQRNVGNIDIGPLEALCDRLIEE